MSSEKVARLRQLMSEAVPRNSKQSEQEAETNRQFRLYEFNAGLPPLVIEQTPRARSERDIERIAAWYGWNNEILRALDAARAESLQALSDSEVEELRDRMRRLEECVREGLDCPDAPPAR